MVADAFDAFDGGGATSIVAPGTDMAPTDEPLIRHTSVLEPQSPTHTLRTRCGCGGDGRGGGGKTVVVVVAAVADEDADEDVVVVKTV